MPTIFAYGRFIKYMHALDRAFRMSHLTWKSGWISVWTGILIVIPVPVYRIRNFQKHYSGSGSTGAGFSIYPVSGRIFRFRLGPSWELKVLIHCDTFMGRPETEPEYPAGYRIHWKSGSGWAGTGVVFLKIPDSVNRNRNDDQNSGSYRNSPDFQVRCDIRKALSKACMYRINFPYMKMVGT